MSLKYNSFEINTCESIINDYLAYFTIIKKDFLSQTSPIMIKSITVKLSLSAFTDKDSIITVLNRMNVTFDEKTLHVYIPNDNVENNPINSYKLFCHEFLSIYMATYLNHYCDTEFNILIDKLTKRILKFSLINMYKDFVFYFNTLSFSNFLNNISFKNLIQKEG
jgi:hypothetical protein